MKKYYKKETPRFDYQEIDPADNLPDLLNWAANDDMVALIDEESGGIIGYINKGHIDMIYSILNKTKHEIGVYDQTKV